MLLASHLYDVAFSPLDEYVICCPPLYFGVHVFPVDGYIVFVQSCAVVVVGGGVTVGGGLGLGLGEGLGDGVVPGSSMDLGQLSLVLLLV